MHIATDEVPVQDVLLHEIGEVEVIISQEVGNMTRVDNGVLSSANVKPADLVTYANCFEFNVFSARN